jgi:hypothetical protein
VISSLENDIDIIRNENAKAALHRACEIRA